jgi:hypothetical protein
LVVVIVGFIGTIGGDVPSVGSETRNESQLTSDRNSRQAPGIAPKAAAGDSVLQGGVAAAKDWCQTQERWEAKGLGGVAALSCDLGTCDLPAVRDTWIPTVSTPILELNIHFNVFANSDGSNPASTQAGVDAQVVQLNNDYAPSKIHFCYTADFINSTTYRQFADSEEFDMKNAHANNPATKLNVYVVNVEGSYAAFGTFPWDPDSLTNMGGIVIDDNYFGTAQSTLAHEVGHCVGLWHTHHGVSEVGECCVLPAGLRNHE